MRIDLRRRSAAPVSHQVRPFCQLRPASCRVRAMVNRLTHGRPSGAWRRLQALAAVVLCRGHVTQPVLRECSYDWANWAVRDLL